MLAIFARIPCNNTYNCQILKYKVQTEAGPFSEVYPPGYGSNFPIRKEGRYPLERLEEAKEAKESSS